MTTTETAEARARIERKEYPEIIQAVRWSDEDNGTNHFEPGVGFVVDDPDGLLVPERWLPHLPVIEQALSSLDHAAPHPLDVDTIEYLARENKEATIYDSAAYCFVCGEHTPMTAMQRSSRELWIASRFLNEYFEAWEIDPAAGWDLLSAVPDASPGSGERCRVCGKGEGYHLHHPYGEEWHEFATPSAPTAERLQGAIGQALKCTSSVRDGEIVYDCGDPWEILRAALSDAGEGSALDQPQSGEGGK